jgi:hypothetical protein
MPIDPFFTSAVSQKQRPLSAKVRREFMKAADPTDKLKKLKHQRKRGRPHIVTGGPALTGFKPPRLVWNQSQ